jgi:hypothetical protein
VIPKNIEHGQGIHSDEIPARSWPPEDQSTRLLPYSQYQL